MSTNATITVLNHSKGTATTIYNHWDGDSYLLNMLKEHYNTQELADALVALGDVSSLRPSIDAPAGHSFETPADGCSIFYGRDRGEADTEASVQDIDNFLLRKTRYGSQQYNYLFVDGEWKRFNGRL